MINDFHPDDAEAHRIIKRVCGIPTDAKLSNEKAIHELLSEEKYSDALTEHDEAFLQGWLQR
jgi:hypothetical protein